MFTFQTNCTEYSLSRTVCKQKKTKKTLKSKKRLTITVVIDSFLTTNNYTII